MANFPLAAYAEKVALEITDLQFQQAYQAFVDDHPAYVDTQHIDEIRREEYSRLDRHQHVYLDYTGASLYSEKLVLDSCKELNETILGNPHSFNRPSLNSGEGVEKARNSVLEFVNAGPEYCAIFTANASQAIKLVGESFPFCKSSRLLLSTDNHNSINGLTSFAKRLQADIEYIPLEDFSLRMSQMDVLNRLKKHSGAPSLFAFPAQSNYSGIKHPLDWLEMAKNENWYTLLDVAAFMPTNSLDLSKISPDFICLSFYKMFGYPTGIGCLIAKKEALRKMKRPWFSGGTVIGASVKVGEHILSGDEAGFEDGTVNYALLPVVSRGLTFLADIGMDSINKRVMVLCEWLLRQMKDLRHCNEQALIQIYGPDTNDRRGGTIAFNLRDPNNEMWDPGMIEYIANEYKISIRTGNHCNPGINEVAHNIESSLIESLYQNKESEASDNFLWGQQEIIPGVARISLGTVSNFKDVFSFVQFLLLFMNRKANDW